MSMTGAPVDIQESRWARYALREAGAPFTILAFRCGHCHRELFVTESVPYGPPTAAMLQEIDETP
jgi:hypothetical protein